MNWVAVKDIKLRKWGAWQRVVHSRPGTVVRLRKLFRSAAWLLRDAQRLTDLCDRGLRREAERVSQGASPEAPIDPQRLFPPILEAIRREMGFVLHPNQVVAALAMSRGEMVELATGEGKTLVTLLTALALALGGHRVHVFTANRYLAQRDAQLAGKVAGRLGLKVGCLHDAVPRDERPTIYRRPIVYATLAEIAFDWLRDRLAMCRGESALVPRLGAVIVDEADMVMIDDARTPLVLAEIAAGDRSALYHWAADVAGQMQAGIDYTVADGQVTLTRESRRWFRDVGGETAALVARDAILATLRVRLFYRRNVHYVVQDEEVVIVDEKTGRLMPGRRWQDGLYEAAMIHEGLELDGSHRHSAQITVQQYLAQYARLCGCSGTMAEAAMEMQCIYGLSSLRVPTHHRCRRREWRPAAYATRSSQFRAIVEQIRSLRAAGRPVLVGSTHIATSEQLSALLRSEGIEHELLTALKEADEAEIVAQAGRSGAVTIATNMAGRGTDIKLTEDACQAGGLHVISLQRHDSSRVDRQLVGRCARQGDPGSCQFILYLQDPLLRPHIARLRRKHLTPHTRNGRAIRSPLLSHLWRARQRVIERQHLRTRLALVEREASLQALYGKPYYLADQPPIRTAKALV